KRIYRVGSEFQLFPYHTTQNRMLVYRKEHKLSLTFLPVTFNEMMVTASMYIKQAEDGLLIELTAPDFCTSSVWKTTLPSNGDLMALPQRQVETFLDILMKAESKL